MPVTIRDLSRHCGFSVATISKALNGYTDISEATRDAVLRAAQELGYHPNSHARALKSGRSYNLGVLFADDSNSGLTHFFFSGVLESFKKAAEEHGYDITFICHGIGGGHQTFLEHCHSREVDGVCVAAVDFRSEEVRQLAVSDLPLVTIDHPFRHRDCVQSDNEGGMSMLTRYAYEQGHRRIACLHGQPGASADSRLRGFRQTVQELGLTIPEAYVRECLYNTPDRVAEIFRELMALPEPPTCVFCPDDYAALGAYRAAAELGLSIPGDVSVAGFDGIAFAQLLTPRLTTVRQDQDRIGRTAAELLIRQLSAPQEVQPQSVTIPCTLTPGGSIAAPAV